MNSSAPGNPQEKRSLSNLQLLWTFSKRYPLQVTAFFVSLFVAAVSTLAIPRSFQRIVDNGFGAETDATIAPYFYGMLAVVAVLGIATSVRFYYVSWLGERVVADLRQSVHANLLTLDPAFFEENRPSEIASRLTADTSIIEQVVGTSLSMALRNVILGIGGVIYLFTISPKLTVMLLLGIPLAVLPMALMGRRVQALSRSSQDSVASVGTIISEVLSAIRIVQAFTQERNESARFNRAVEATFAAARRRIRMRALLTAIVITIIFGGITLVLWEGASDVINNVMTGGEITAFVLTAAIVAGAFGALAEVYGDVMRATGAAGRMKELLVAVPQITAPANPAPLPQPPIGRVSFESVDFRYPTRKDTPALSDFSLDIAPGETVAVVGPSGAGKSTLFQLIQRFYDPQGGTVRVDGVALRDADPAAVRGRIAMVPQESVIFAESAYNNILYGRPGATEAEVWAAADAANASDFLRALPDGIHTFLGEAGARLSGGQRQRLSIARAVLRDAPILLLDEATSALDAESERLVQEALERLMQGRTTLVIAHRLATVRGADRIIVMNEGRIVGQGRHDELMTDGGLYARLARLQFEDAA
ncbi:ABC transporter transmembrane domain-containing protein [Sphingosinicella soli]|uniref:ATP-binding cassette subfamily B protein n=1 Tax=Sphingosinicella soli TaxID=333708 RepID=A0A7W7B4Y0_9SPHN|nr:ABC transporter transmembrane domain-containing protein [Sphingosinicella soli]MBB4633180.1 ATP-binding cassette subfamily B protein [Sphingosinicella soli]